MNKTIKSLVILMAFVASCYSIEAQVTIGGVTPPVEGALLQIKDIEPQSGFETNLEKNITSTTGGLILPRVLLTNTNSLIPIINNATTADMENHTGLIVYNVGGAGALDAGIYYWDTDKWHLIHSDHIYTSPWYKVDTELSAKNNNDDVYLNAKVVVNNSGTATNIEPEGNSKLTVRGNDASLRGVRLGHGAAKLPKNIVFGNNALINTNAKDNNIALGFNTLSHSNNQGESNIAIGEGALPLFETGSDVIAVGHQAANTATAGSNNILLGQGVQPTTATSNNEIRINNVIYGNMATGTKRVGINTTNPQATLDVDGKVRFTEGSAISSGKILRIDANGFLKKSKIATRKAAFVASTGEQSINKDQINSGHDIAVVWNSGDIRHNDGVLVENTATVNELTITREGIYELSGSVYYNPKAVASSTRPTSAMDWLALVNVSIEYRTSSSASWIKLMNVASVYSAAALLNPKLIEIPPMAAELTQGSQVRMVLSIPDIAALNHGSGTTNPTISKFSNTLYTKTMKIISL